MTTKTFSNTSGGSWELGANWTPTGIPGSSDDALISTPGTYTVVMGSVESPNSVTLSDAAATLSISASGLLVTSPVTLNAGTLALSGAIEGSTVVNNGGVFAPSGGTLDAVTWQGPMNIPTTTYYTINIEDGLTLLNQAGTGPGTLDIANLYMVNILDSTPLSNMTINIDAYNNEYLTGSSSLAMVFDKTMTLNESLSGAMGQIGGAKLINNGLITATGVSANLYFQSTIFDNVGTLLAADTDHVTIGSSFSNTGSMGVSANAKLTIGDPSPNTLSNTGTISVTSLGSLTVSSGLAGNGVITLANLAVVDLYNTSNTVTFLDGKDILRLESPGTFTGDISGLQKGDKIDLLATPVTTLDYAGTTASGVLTVLNNGTTVAALSLLGDYTQSTFAFGGDGATGNDISVVVNSIVPRTLGWTGADGTSAFNAPSNWNDISDTLNPALTAPGTIDTVLFNTANGAISGTNTVAQVDIGLSGVGVLELSAGAVLDANGLDAGFGAADVAQVGLTGSGSDVAITGVAIVGDGGAGAMSVLNGATFSASSLILGSQSKGSGATDVSSAGSQLNVSGALVVGSAGYGSLSVSQGAVVTAASVVEASGAAGDGVISVTGTGSALTLTGSLTVGSQGAGEVSVLNGATVSALDVTIGNASALSSGNVDVEGLGSELFVGTGGVLNVGVAGGGSGELTIGPGTTLHSNAGVVESGHASYNNNGGSVDPPFVDITTPANAGLGSNLYDLYVENIDAVQVDSGTGTWDTPMMLTGTSVSDAQNNINVNGDTGEWQLSSGGTLIVNANTVDSGQAFVFEDATDTLTIGQIVNNGSAGVSGTPPMVEPGAENVLQAGGFAGEIWGYQTGDQITFDNMSVTSASVVNGNTVDLFVSGNVSLGSLAFFTKTGSKTSNAGAAAAALQIPVQCFAAGTRIETIDGSVPVEDLRVGDQVITVDGSHEPIVWIGQRRVNCARHPKPEMVWPVRVQTGAFSDNVPVRDLYLSPNHAVFVNDVLVPVKLLINGTSIAQVKRPAITYFHMELSRHDVILAEGLTVESYLDVGDRADFHGGREPIRLFPDFAARRASRTARYTAQYWAAHGAAPLVMTGEALARARRLVVAPKAVRSRTKGVRRPSGPA